MHRRWLDEHEERLDELRRDVRDVAARAESFGESAQQRLNSDDYTTIVRKAACGTEAKLEKSAT